MAEKETLLADYQLYAGGIERSDTQNRNDQAAFGVRIAADKQKKNKEWWAVRRRLSIYTGVFIVLVAIPMIVFIVKKKGFGKIGCWFDSASGTPSPTELGLKDEVDVTADWNAWFTSTYILYIIQEAVCIIHLILGWITGINAWDGDNENYHIAWYSSIGLLVLVNIGFNVWGAVIRANTSGQKCSEVAVETSDFMEIWLSVAWSVTGLFAMVIICLFCNFIKSL